MATVKVPAKVVAKVARLEELKHQSEQIVEEVNQIRAELLKDVTKAGVKTLPVEIGDRIVKVTVVESKSVLVIDEAALKNALGEKGWMRVSTRIMDRKKLEASIAANETDPQIVAECSVEVPGKAPYIKVT
jgi:hypothetical protein